MYSAITVADHILKRAKANGKLLTPLQLMKLVYIAHGWSLAVREKDLFPDRIEAWKYGPVIPDLYQATKRFGRTPIPADLIDSNPSGLDPEAAAFVDDVYDKYGALSGIALSNLTHKSGTPWDQLYYEGVYNTEIPDEIIKAHYKKLLDDGIPSTASAA